MDEVRHGGKVTIAVHLYAKHERDTQIQRYIENRDRNKYPNYREYVMAAIEAFETKEEDKTVTLSVLREELATLKSSLMQKHMLP